MTSPADIDHLNQQAHRLYRLKNGQVMACAQQACTQALAIGYTAGYREGLINQGRAHVLHGAFKEAIALFSHVLALAEEEQHALQIADCLQEIARGHYTVGDYDMALQYWSRCLDAATNAQAHELWLRALIGLGQIYLAHGDAGTALAHHRWAQKSWREGNDPTLYDAACLNIAVDLYEMQCHAEALNVLAQVRETPAQQSAEIQGILGLIQHARGDLDGAEKALQTARQLNQSHQNALGLATNLLTLGRLAMLRNDLVTAQQLLEEALDAASSMGTQHLMFQIELALAEIHELRQEWQEALAHYKRYHLLQQDIQRKVSPHKLQAMEMQLEVEKARMENARLRRKHATERQERYRIERMAGEDALTGLLNRRGLEQSAEVLLYQQHDPVTALMIDIDHFKPINDTWGHETGDKVLRQVAALLKSGCRQGDLVSRWGGEEFAVLLQNRTASQAAEVAERLRRLVAGWSWDRIIPEQTVTISVGIAEHFADHDLAHVIQRADEKLYQAKRSGRNLVVL